MPISRHRSGRFTSLATLSCLSLALLAACSNPSGGKSYLDYPEFQDGGKMTLTILGQAHSIYLDYVHFANTDSGYPDFVEISGEGTFIIVPEPTKGLDFDSETPYAPIVNKPLAITQVEGHEEPMTLNVPNLGAFPVTGGKLTLQKWEVGRDGNDWWDGQIELVVTTASGPQTIGGPFSWCITPVW